MAHIVYDPSRTTFLYKISENFHRKPYNRHVSDNNRTHIVMKAGACVVFEHGKQRTARETAHAITIMTWR